jgi:hypothetical protein
MVAYSNIQASSIPAVNKSYKLVDLFDLINKNNPAMTSNFLVPLNGHQVITDAQCWSVKPDGSASAAQVGLTSSWVKNNANLMVTLLQDEDLINYLCQQGNLLQQNKAQFNAILLYFKLSLTPNGTIYRFYLNDPFPGIVRNFGGKTVNPALMIIEQWIK